MQRHLASSTVKLTPSTWMRSWAACGAAGRDETQREGVPRSTRACQLPESAGRARETVAGYRDCNAQTARDTETTQTRPVDSRRQRTRAEGKTHWPCPDDGPGESILNEKEEKECQQMAHAPAGPPQEASQTSDQRSRGRDGKGTVCEKQWTSAPAH